jgi:phytoene dehydrogenase-like protein
MDLRQLYTRPVKRLVPYRTPRKGVYICSAATPPGGGVHGMCGVAAARVALNDLGLSHVAAADGLAAGAQHHGER